MGTSIISAKTALTILAIAFLPIQQARAQEAETMRVVRVEAVAGMQYAPLRFRVLPGEKIKLVFYNTDDMAHNLVVTRPGARARIVEQALALGEKGPEMNFIPVSPDVLWAVPVLAAGEKDSLVISAPEQEGVYPYVCTFPGHGSIMYGAMYVGNSGWPPLSEDLHIPKVAENMQASHPYELRPPYFYRMYMPAASPAAIAVRLSDHLSYCWDAGTCRLLYSWEGGFIDNSVAWKGHRNAEAELLGKIFYKAEDQCPIRTENPRKIPEVDYKGFRLVDGYPEFHYTADGLDVYELVQPGSDGHSLVVTFRIPGYGQGLWLDLEAKGDYTITSPAGQWAGSLLKIPAEQVREFSVTITQNMKE